jgi:hypothetical protein
LPWLTSLAPPVFPWPAALPPGRVLASGALTTPVSVIATSAPARLNARGIAHRPRLCPVSLDRHPDVPRPPVPVLEPDEGAMRSTFYRQQ